MVRYTYTHAHSHALICTSMVHIYIHIVTRIQIQRHTDTQTHTYQHIYTHKAHIHIHTCIQKPICAHKIPHAHTYRWEKMRDTLQKETEKQMLQTSEAEVTPHANTVPQSHVHSHAQTHIKTHMIYVKLIHKYTITQVDVRESILYKSKHTHTRTHTDTHLHTLLPVTLTRGQFIPKTKVATEGASSFSLLPCPLFSVLPCLSSLFFPVSPLSSLFVLLSPVFSLEPTHFSPCCHKLSTNTYTHTHPHHTHSAPLRGWRPKRKFSKNLITWKKRCSHSSHRQIHRHTKTYICSTPTHANTKFANVHNLYVNSACHMSRTKPYT